MFFWWLGVSFTLINTLRKLKALKAQLKTLVALSEKEDKPADIDKQVAGVQRQIDAAHRSVIKCLGDAIPSGAGWGLYETLGISVGDTAIGLGGLVSALVACYENYINLK